jgi:hypothetical protein
MKSYQKTLKTKLIRQRNNYYFKIQFQFKTEVKFKDLIQKNPLIFHSKNFCPLFVSNFGICNNYSVASILNCVD